MNTRLTLYIVCFIFMGCSMDTVGSNDVRPEAIHQDYSLHYRESNNATSMSAQFRVGGSTGTTVELEPPSQLSMNGATPKKSGLFGTSYSLAHSGPIAHGQFDYRDSYGQLYTNSVTLKSLMVHTNLMPAMLGANYYVPISTYPMEPGDSISAVLKQEFVENGVTRYVFVEGVYQASPSQVVFSAYDLSRLRAGVAQLELARVHRRSLDAAAPRGGGEISSQYSVRPVALTIYGQNFAPSPLLPL